MNDLPFYPLPHEPPKAFSAFLAWLDCGDRCCAKIAATASLSTSTIQTWSRRFDWGGRAAASASSIQPESAQTENVHTSEEQKVRTNSALLSPGSVRNG